MHDGPSFRLPRPRQIHRNQNPLSISRAIKLLHSQKLMSWLSGLWRTSRPSYRNMPGRFPDEESASGESESLLGRGHKRVKHFWDGFIDFAFQDDILKIAVGLILAAAFTDLVKSFVSNVLMPPISVILPLNKNMEEKFAVLQKGPNYNATSGYNTLHQAQDDGAVVLAYGSFIGQMISFLILGIALYGLAHLWQLASSEPIIKHTKKCKYCRQRINEKSIRCIQCTSWLDGREDRT